MARVGKKHPDAELRRKVLKDQFTAFSRKPFMEILADLCQCPPEPHRLQEFANQYPDRWASAIKTMAGLSGYHEKLEIEGNITVQIQQMGDAELLQRVEEVNKKLLALNEDEYQELEVGEMFSESQIEVDDS